MSSEDLVERVIEITGVERTVAQNLLEACTNDVEAAIALFFEQGGIGENVTDPVETIDVDEDNVRAPIAPIMEQLILPEDDNFYAPPTAPSRRARLSQRVKVCPLRDFAREGALMEEQLHVGGPSMVTALDMSDSSSCMNSRRVRSAMLVAQANTEKKQNTKKSSLGDLFRPPTDIAYAGSFQAARQHATKSANWLLVNVQSDNFDSQLLNRDVWSNKDVRKVLKGQFLLWQVDSDSIEGRRFITFYHCGKTPYVCVIDPRTGEEIWNSPEPKESTILPDLKKFLRKHKDFSEEMGDDCPSTSSKCQVKAIKEDDVDILDVNSPAKRLKLMELSEEEQIALAIRNSVRDSCENNGTSKVETVTNGNKNDKHNNDDVDNEDSCSGFDSIEEFVDDDTKGPFEQIPYEKQLGLAKDELTAIKLRLLNANAVEEIAQLRWPSDTELSVIHLYIAQTYPHISKRNYKIICAYPRKTLEKEHDKKTLKEFGLHPSANLHVTLDD